VLAVLPDRLKTSVLTWLVSMPDAIRARITTVCTDIWEGYITAVEQALPNATIVLDRFHIIRHARDGVDTLRKQEVRRLKKELPTEAADELKHTLWPFRKRSDALDTAEQERLETLLTASPALRQAYGLREQLTSIFDTARSKADRLRRLRLWRRRVEKSELCCFDPFLKLLSSRLDLIANYFFHLLRKRPCLSPISQGSSLHLCCA